MADGWVLEGVGGEDGWGGGEGEEKVSSAGCGEGGGELWEWVGDEWGVRNL